MDKIINIICIVRGREIPAKETPHRHIVDEWPQCDSCGNHSPLNELKCFNSTHNINRDPQELHLCKRCYSNAQQNWGR